MAARLVFLNADKAGAAVNLGETPVTIGRNPGRTIVYSPDEIVVSNDHATIQFRNGRYYIRDDGSRNHTIVNAEVVAERMLEHGDIIQFGEGGPSVRFIIEEQLGMSPTKDLPARTTGSHRTATGRHTSAMPAIVAASHDTPEDTSPATRNRRNFLRAASVVAGTATAALAGIPALFSFISPLIRGRREPTWINLGETYAFETGVPNKKDFPQTRRDAWVETRSILSVWVYTDDGEQFTVYDARCTHLGCGYNFVKETGKFQCPCHQGVFEPKTGAVLSGPPPRPLDRLPSKIEDGVLYVQLA